MSNSDSPDLPEGLTELPRSQQPRAIKVEVRKRRPVVCRAPTRGPKGAESSVTTALPQIATGLPTEIPKEITPGEALDKQDVDKAAPPAFRPLDTVPHEPAPWQVVGLLKKTGVTVLVTPPGACSFALCAFFAGYLAGRTFAPFGPVRYPGDVLFSTHTRHLDSSLRAAISSLLPGQKHVLTRRTRHRFDWKESARSLAEVMSGHASDPPAAVIIDAGPMSQRIQETTVEDACAEMDDLAERVGCLVLLVVEATSRNSDPFERIPKSLRGWRGTLLAVPLRSKALAPHPGAPAEFLLLRLAEAAAATLTARFSLRPGIDLVETTSISWGHASFEDPREAFRTSETVDLSNAQRTAVQLAVEIIQDRGPTSSQELQAAGQMLRRIAKTTMRDALSVAKLLGHLDTARTFDGRIFWIIPGVTPIPSGMYLPHALTDREIPF